MADTAAPARTRKAAPVKAATAKAAPATAAPKAEAPTVTAPEDDGIQRLKIELVPAGDTRRYAKFSVPESFEGVAAGSIYVPKGTTRVILGIEGPAE